MTTAMSQLREWALHFAARGWRVFPVHPGTKRPAISRWEHRATTETERIERCWNHAPYNIGIGCGPSGLVVVDCDMPDEGEAPPDGWNMPGISTGGDVFAHLADRAQATVPETYTVTTPSGGVHYYFQAPTTPQLRNTAKELGWLVDTRAHGGLVVAPGSITPQGTYELHDDAEPADLPGWLHQRLANKAAQSNSGSKNQPITVAEFAPRCRSAYVRAALRSEMQRLAETGTGVQNHALFHASLALGRLVAGGSLHESTARAGLHQSMSRLPNTRPDQPWTATDIDRTINSGFRAAARNPRHITNDQDTAA